MSGRALGLWRAFGLRIPANGLYHLYHPGGNQELDPEAPLSAGEPIRAGLNGPLFLLNELAGDPIRYDGYLENLTMMRYWNEIYAGPEGHIL